MPQAWHQAAQAGNATARARVVTDYIAGMTDRFALQEHRQLNDPLFRG